MKEFCLIVQMAKHFATSLGLTGDEHKKKVRELVEVVLADIA
jgi:hypothetical protein